MPGGSSLMTQFPRQGSAPNTVPLGVRVPTYEFEGTHSVHSNRLITFPTAPLLLHCGSSHPEFLDVPVSSL